MIDLAKNTKRFMIKRLLLLPIIFISTGLFAQQATQYSLQMFNEAGINPAYAGLDNSLVLTGIYRNQWQGLDQSPNQQNINIHMPVYRLSGGIGINVDNDRLGLERNLLATLDYNFHLPLNRSSKISFGIGAGFFQKSLDGSDIRTPEGIYSTGGINHNDNLPLPERNISITTPTFNAGVYYKSDALEIGLSSRNIQEPELIGDNFSTTLSRNYFLTASYNLDLSGNISLHPSILVKTDQTEWQSEISLLVKYDDNIFLGGSFRGYNSNTIDAVALIAGLNISEKIKVAYAYDLTLSKLNWVSNGGQEILIQYNLGREIGKGKLPKVIFNPRF